MVDDHLALLLLPHFLHKHLNRVTGEHWPVRGGDTRTSRVKVFNKQIGTAGGLQFLSLNVKSS